MKKWIILAIIAFLAGGGAWWYMSPRTAAGKEETAPPATVQVQKGAVRKVVSTTGYVVPFREIEIKCKASGEVEKVPFDISDTVKAGDLLLELDPKDEEFNVQNSMASLLSAQGRLAQAEITLEIAQNTLATERRRADVALGQAEAAEKDTAAKAERLQQLWEKNLASQEEYETAQTAAVKARADLENARVRMDELKSDELTVRLRTQDVELRETEVGSYTVALSQAGDRLADTKIMAPIDGVITARNVQPGQIIASAISNVGGGTAVFALADLSRMYVYAAVDESDIGSIAADQPAEIAVDAHPGRTFKGKVERIGVKGKNVSNVITYEVRIEILGRNAGLLKPEMSADIDIVVADKSDILVVPADAVQRRKGEDTVLIPAAGGTPEPRVVQTGVRDDTSVEIVSGLAEGETVIANANAASGKWKRPEQGGRPRGMMPGFPGMH